jgi:hypothetical protein
MINDPGKHDVNELHRRVIMMVDPEGREGNRMRGGSAAALG